MEPLKAGIGAGLRLAFDKAGVNQKRLAMQLGVAEGVVSSWVNGKTEPSGEGMAATSQMCDVSPAWLLTGVEDIRSFSAPPESIIGGPEPGSLTYDGQLLLETVLAVEKLFEEEDLDPPLKTAQKSLKAESIYEMSLYRKHLMSTKEIRKILRLVG